MSTRPERSDESELLFRIYVWVRFMGVVTLVGVILAVLLFLRLVN